MPVVTPACELRRRARKGCDEECLRRIAARLCRLDECSSTINATAEASEPAEDEMREASSGCCGPQTTVDGRDGCCDERSGNAPTLACPPDGEVKKDCCGNPTSGDEECDDVVLEDATSYQRNEKNRSVIERARSVSGCCSGKEKQKVEGCDQARGSSLSTSKTDCCKETAITEVKKSCSNAKDRIAGKDAPAGCCRSEGKVNVEECKQGGNEKKISTAESHEQGDAEPQEPVCGSTCDLKSSYLGNGVTREDACCSSKSKEKKPGLQVSNKECCEDRVDSSDLRPFIARGNHLQAAFDRYESLLRMGLCLCRRVQKQLGFSCCTMGPDGMPLKDQFEGRSDQEPRAGLTCDTQIHSRCSQQTVLNEVAKEMQGSRSDQCDVENAAAREHIVLSVSGMTCTGCSRKMMNVMGNIAGTSNCQVTFVTETAEFDLDNSITDTRTVFARIEKETGFKVSRLVSGYQNLDVSMNAATAADYSERLIDGVVSVTKVSKQTWRIMYDPRVVGARSLLCDGVELAPPTPNDEIAEGRRRLIHMIIAFTSSLILTLPVVVLNWAPNSVSHLKRSIISLVFATLVQAIAVSEFYVAALKSLIYSRVIEMDMLVVISVTAAYLYSVVAFALQEAGFRLEQEAFFETATLLTTLILLGRLISAVAKVRAVSAVSLRSLQANTAWLIEQDGTTNKIDARLLQFGDIVRIPPHSNIVTDGKVVSGESAADESMVTGESTPVRKEPGDMVVAGTVNGSGCVDVKIARLPGDNSIADIANLVENAVAAKPRIQDLADKVASRFIPAVIGISVIVFAVWIAVAVEVRNQNAGGAFGTAITYAIAVLAISCPCALGLAVPMVLVIAGGVAAKAGVIIKAADVIERGYQATDVVFDKTGTLTTGTLEVTDEHVEMEKLGDFAVTSLACSLVEDNDHPVSKAVAEHIKRRNGSATRVSLTSKQSIPGAGIQAQLTNSTIKAGNPYWLQLEDHDKVKQVLAAGVTCFCVTIDGELAQIFGLRSQLREEAKAVIEHLQSRGITCHIVSGDAPRAVESVAQLLGVHPMNTVSRSSPAGKQKYVRDLQSVGKRVVFVGDGTNDAVAIAQANVGAQIGSASDFTNAVADVVLLGGLEGIVTLLNISKRAFGRIRFNFIWTGVYNTLAILLAAGAFVKVRIPPGYAGLGEIVSIAPVILAAVSLAFKWKT